MTRLGVVVGFAVAGFFAVTAMAESQCEGESASVSGWVKTINLGPTTQTGFIHLRIKPKGKPFFDETGAIVGQVVSGPDANGQSTLEHTAYFGQLNRLYTHNDQATLVPTGKLENGQPCEFFASEVITQATGTRSLRPLTNTEHNIMAEGTVSFCSDNNNNEFVLSGTACID